MAKDSILLVDPFRNLIDAYQMLLAEEQYAVESVLSIEEACRLCQTRRFSVVITEYFTPFEKTSRVVRLLKQHAPETYIIIMTHLTISESTYEKLLEQGVDDLIVKPFSPAKTLAHIKKGLRQKELILKKEQLESQSCLDPVAQQIHEFIFKPLFFKKCLRQELKKANRHQYPLSLLLIQIPIKEEIGDRFEDFYLELVKIIRMYVREEDIVGREDGHFGVLLPKTDQTGCRALHDRLAKLIQEHPAFQSDEEMKLIARALPIEPFTYPDQFSIPETLRTVVEEV